MIYNLLRAIENRNIRRLVGVWVLIFFIPAVLVALAIGTLLHVFIFVKDYVIDLRVTLTQDIPRTFADFVSVARTGKEI